VLQVRAGCWMDASASTQSNSQRSAPGFCRSPWSHPDPLFSLVVTPVSLVTPWKGAGAERTSNALKCGELGALVGHEDGQLCVLQDVPGGPAKDQLPNAALGVGTLHQKIGPKLPRLRQNGRTGRASFVLTGERRGRNPMQPKGCRDLLPARTLNGRPP
jgi:hypothetical protein